jgi:glycosyltransferase involved in cell wall biosynthesis
MMRILFVGQSYIVAESRKKLVYLAKQPNVNVSLIVPTTWEHESFGRYTFQHVGPDSAMTIFPTPIRNNGRVFAFYYDPISVWRIVRQIQPDLIQVEQEPGSLSLLQFVFLATLQSRVKLIAFTWENLMYRLPLARQLLERLELPQLDCLLAGSTTSAQVFRVKGYRGRLDVLPNVGIDPDHFTSRPAPGLRVKFGEKFIVGFVGRLIVEKGCLDLLDAFTSLPENCHLLFIGNGNLRDELEQLVRERGMASRVTFQPTVPHVQVPDWLNCMDCLVLPSRTTAKWREQFGLVLAQAMACGVPVIGSNSGAIPEVIDNAGLIFPEGDVNALRDCLARLSDDPGLRTVLIAKGRARVLANYTHEHIANQTYAIYQELLKPR